MSLAPLAMDDPTAALAQTRAIALAALHDELAAATSAATDAAAGVPSTTFDWIGPSSTLFADAAARLHRDIEGARHALATATRIVEAELA